MCLPSSRKGRWLYGLVSQHRRGHSISPLLDLQLQPTWPDLPPFRLFLEISSIFSIATMPPAKAPPYLVYLVFIATFGPLQFGYHLVLGSLLELHLNCISGLELI